MDPLWTHVSSHLRKRLSTDNFNTWIEPIVCSVDGHIWLLRVPNRFYIDWISAHYLDLIADAAASAGATCPDEPANPSTKPEFRWEVDETLGQRTTQEATKKCTPLSEPAPQSVQLQAAQLPDGRHTASSSGPRSRGLLHNSRHGDTTLGVALSATLNPKYDFDQFIVGPSNELAHAACLAAASSPGYRYNPLFIYGGVGLGKTHLVNAVGHRILTDNPKARIHYLSAEQFTNEFISALQNHKIHEFRKRYRQSCDVLLMDDIQFLAGRVQTQEEFFHTFNALYHEDCQIVVTSDAFPQQIEEMQERLVSRFQCGLVADIQAPELDTRVAILRKKAEQESIELNDEVVSFIAQHISSNVRELEGSLLRLAVKAELSHEPITIDLAKETLRAVLPSVEQAATVEDIQQRVCEHFRVRLSDLKSHRRHRAISVPRMIAMYLCRQHLNTSYPELGERFGGKDHTTVINAVRRITDLLSRDDQIQSAVGSLEKKISR